MYINSTVLGLEGKITWGFTCSKILIIHLHGNVQEHIIKSIKSMMVKSRREWARKKLAFMNHIHGAQALIMYTIVNSKCVHIDTTEPWDHVQVEQFDPISWVVIGNLRV